MPCFPVRSHAKAVARPLRAGRRGRAAVAAGIAACSFLVSSAANAAQAGRLSPDNPAARSLAADSHVTLAALEARAAKLSRQYRGQLVKLTDAVSSAKAAEAQAAVLRRQLRAAQQQIARLAAASYMGGEGLDPAFGLLTGGDAQRVLERTATVAYLAGQRSAIAERLLRLTVAANRADQAAQAKVGELRQMIASLVSQQRAVQRLLAKFRPQSPTIGGDQITPRMREVRDEIDQRFGPFPSIGCYRPGGDGEHPLGRACDFMLSTGGVMPSPAWVQRGYDIAAWAQANAARLGIMYIIYRQRIWDIRMASSGWVPMADRGSITANHFDHVHISVF